jgi:hypothetical protein
MKKIFIALGVFTLYSCQKESQVQVTNRVGNCRIESISFGEYRLSGGLITNESSPVYRVKDNKKNFPKKYPFVFYMVSAGNRVYLRTKEEFLLEEGGVLNVTIENATEVQSP